MNRAACAPSAPPGRRAPSAPRLVAALVLGAIGGFLLLLTATAAPVAAHAEPVVTTPANGAALERAPETVTVRFGERVRPVPDGLRVLGPDGTRVDTGEAPADPESIAATLRDGLGDGAYTVSWRAVSADSHPVHGAFTFTVGRTGSAQPPPPGAGPGTDPVLGALVTLTRGAGYAGFALLAGAAGTLLLTAVPGAARARLNRLAAGGGLLVVVAAGADLVAQGPHAAGAGPGGLLDPRFLEPVLTGRTGIALQVRAALTALLLVLVATDRLRPPSGRSLLRRLAVAVLLAAVAATYAATGHAATGHLVPLALAAGVLHLLAMGLWLGGLVALGLLCAGRTGSEPPTAAIRRFSPLAAWCVAVLAVTGLFQANRQLGDPAALLDSGYGRLLVAKTAAVLAVLALAYRARRWVRAHGTPYAAPPPAGALRTVRRTLAVEAVGGALVLILSTLLAGSAPPRDVPAPPAGPAAVRMEAGYDTGGAAGRGTVTARIVRRGDRTGLDLRLAAPSGKPVRPEEVTAAWTLPALALGPLPADLEPAGPGRWRGTTRLSPDGDWRLAVTVRTSDVDVATVVFDGIVAAPGPAGRPAGPEGGGGERR
ncbi:copper resistance protein CopC [Streptomyces sp. HK10]|uniref:copper resistance CopC/CopD family protein n=1 Tax=Streptomyces sp. HK10 TaxID=3373255 RepID=UPI00374A54E1